MVFSMLPSRSNMNTAKKNALAYSATTLAATMMNSIFQFYYVKVYLDLYRLTPGWFSVAQGVFMVWNAVNDPLFGWLQDQSRFAWLSNRRLNILYGAPLFVLSFLIPWFPHFVDSAPMWVLGLHLTFTLCFYDTMFTFVLLAQCSLFAELSLQQDDRQMLVKYSQIASLIGSTSVFFCQYVSWNATMLTHLQVFSVFVAVVSYLSLRYSATHMHPAVKRSDEQNESKSDSGSSDSPPFTILLRQILSNRDFLIFVAMNFCQIFHMTFRSNFFATFADHLIGSEYGTTVLMYLAGVAYVIPQILVLLSGRLLERFGSYQLIRVSFVLKFALALLMFSVGRYQYSFLAFFFVADRSIAEATFALFNLSLSDVIDEDFTKFSRRFPKSSTVFGLNALFTKPAQSLAPILVVNYLEHFGYSSGPRIPLNSSSGKLHSVQDAMFHLLVFFPLVLSLIQLVLWNFYRLRTPSSKKPSDIPTL